MRARVWFRAAAVLLLLFAVGHTIGFLTFRAPTDAGRAVFDAMNTVRFADAHGSYSYGEFYRGFGLWITVSQVFVGFLAWRLGAMAGRGSAGEVKMIGWALVAVQVIGLALSARYFSLPPVIFSAVVAVCLVVGLSRAAPLPEPEKSGRE